MTLTTRLSLFFTIALGVVLVGFSASLYGLARVYLYRQVDDRLSFALDTLRAAAEYGPGGLEWEPKQHVIPTGFDSEGYGVLWSVADGNGRRVDGSRSLNDADFPGLDVHAPPRSDRETVAWRHSPWRLARRHLRETDRGQDIKPEPIDPTETRYAELWITAAVNLQPLQSTLRNLAAILVGLSVGIWLVAALFGRRLCRRALLPVASMAGAARNMNASQIDQRLPEPGTQDELGNLARSFNGLLSRLQESFERQRRFTGDAAHQLQTPLTAMLGQAEVALRRDRSADEYRQVLSLVTEQADQMRSIVATLLFLARADGEARLPDLEPIDLADWTPKHLATWVDHPRHADLRLEIADNKQLWVSAKEPLLSQLLQNLLENAYKYSHSGDPIQVRAEASANRATLSVTDVGSGIAPEDVPHIFEPFFRSSRARRDGVPGIGLGLAVAQRIAVALGGSLTVQSELGRGSTFILSLPLWANGAADKSRDVAESGSQIAIS